MSGSAQWMFCYALFSINFIILGSYLRAVKHIVWLEAFTVLNGFTINVLCEITVSFQ